MGEDRLEQPASQHHYNDANDYNILVSHSRRSTVSAIIDFGDVVYSATVCNLAVALAYVMLAKPDRSAPRR